MPWIKQAQIAKRERLDKLLATAQKVYLEIPEVRGDTIETLRESLGASYKKEKDRPRKFKILLALLGLETLDAGYFLMWAENPNEVAIPLETYEEWGLQDKEYRERMY